jgi:hypothetical protein
MLSLDNSVSVLSSVGLTLVSGSLISILSYSHSNEVTDNCCIDDNNCDTTKCNDEVFKRPCPVGRLSRGVLLTGILSIGASNLLSVVSTLR